MSVRQIQIPQFFYFKTVQETPAVRMDVSLALENAEERPTRNEVKMVSEGLRPEFLRLALEAQLKAIKEENAEDPSFDFVRTEGVIVEELLGFAYNGGEVAGELLPDVFLSGTPEQITVLNAGQPIDGEDA